MPEKNKKTICLNMIVKNENNVIERCLASVKHLIDAWVIVDTGSTDGTQHIIKEFLKEIPGELHERPWVDFGHNRNEAMQLARGKADYLLFIDADDRLVFSENFQLPELELDTYGIVQKEAYGSTFREHQNFFLIKNNDDFKWEGVLHESLSVRGQKSYQLITGVFNEYINDGHRSNDPDKITKDIQVLKKAIQENPENSRYVFYLARTYWSIRDCRSAITYFKQRAEMGGDPQEVYYSLLYIGLAQHFVGDPPETFIDSLYKAFLFRPTRSESLYEIGRYYAETNNFFLGYLIFKFILSMPMPSDFLFVETWVHDWGALLYFFICADRIGKVDEAQMAHQHLIHHPHLPLEVRNQFKVDQWGARRERFNHNPFIDNELHICEHS